MALDSAAYARQLKQLLPRGRLWALEADSLLSALLLAMATELARIDARGEDLVDEWDPRTALETLDDWEFVLGITPADGATASERQNAITAAIVARGGQTAAYFEDLAARLGFVAVVTDGAVADTWTMTVNLAASSASATLRISEFRAGTARSGDRIANRDVAELEDVINAAKPAHTLALYVYT